MTNIDYSIPGFKKIKKCCVNNDVLLIDLYYDYESAMTHNSVEYYRYIHCIVIDKHGIRHNVSDSTNKEVIDNIKELTK